METTMESYGRVANAKRFIVEDSITKVTSDGEPHGMMTAVAGLAGLFAAFVILAVLASLVACKKNHSSQRCHRECASSLHSSETSNSCNKNSLTSLESNRSSISTIYKGNMDELICRNLNTFPLYPAGNLRGNINAAFVGSQLSLNHKTTLSKLDAGKLDKAKETSIDIERF